MPVNRDQSAPRSAQDSKRRSRKFRPVVEGTLERRAVLSTIAGTEAVAAGTDATAAPTPTDTTAEVSTLAATARRATPAQTAARLRAQAQASQLRQWNTSAAWRWINGRWSTRLRADLIAALARQSGNAAQVTETQSVDTWSTDAEGVKVRSGNADPNGEPEPAILFHPDGVPTFRFGMTDTAGNSGAVILRATSATRTSITFRGEVTGASTNATGQLVTTSTPLSVTVRRTGPNGFQVTSDIGDPSVRLRLLTYTATKLPNRPTGPKAPTTRVTS